jgi:hypothetical protein
MKRDLSAEDAERKKAIFDMMSPRRQRHIQEKVGYDNWDPFLEPQDPIDLRKEKTNRTALQLARDFLSECDEKRYSNAYGQGVWDMCLGIINDDDRYRGMYEFSCWYKNVLEKLEME